MPSGLSTATESKPSANDHFDQQMIRVARDAHANSEVDALARRGESFARTRGLM